VEDLERADEVFITSTTRNLLPVASVDGRALGGDSRVRDILETAFERYIDAYLAEAPDVAAGRKAGLDA
jgi:branched-subunit amino acid aminotransferase/4-amino-4-deoxychorismate lyase